MLKANNVAFHGMRCNLPSSSQFPIRKTMQPQGSLHANFGYSDIFKFLPCQCLLWIDCLYLTFSSSSKECHETTHFASRFCVFLYISVSGYNSCSKMTMGYFKKQARDNVESMDIGYYTRLICGTDMEGVNYSANTMLQHFPTSVVILLLFIVSVLEFLTSHSVLSAMSRKTVAIVFFFLP